MAREPHITEVRVRWNECDPAGIVYFPNYFTYFELGSMDFFRQHRAEWQALRERHGLQLFPRLAASARYRVSARFDDVLAVHTRVAEVSRKVVTFGHELYRVADGVLIAEGEVKAVFTAGAGGALTIPPAVAAWLLGTPTADGNDGEGTPKADRPLPLDLTPPDA